MTSCLAENAAVTNIIRVPGAAIEPADVRCPPRRGRSRGSLRQLALNLSGIGWAGVLALLLQQYIWRRVRGA